MPSTQPRKPPKGTKAKIFHMKPYHWRMLERISSYLNKNNHDTLRHIFEVFDARIAGTTPAPVVAPKPTPTPTPTPYVGDAPQDDEEEDDSPLDNNPWAM